MGESCPTATARSASPARRAAAASATASIPLAVWFVMHAFGPLKAYRIPIWQRTVLGRGELATEDPQAPPRGGEQGEVIVLVLVGTAAPPDIDPRAIIEQVGLGGIKGVTMRDEPGIFYRLRCGVQPEKIGAPDELVELSILH